MPIKSSLLDDLSTEAGVAAVGFGAAGGAAGGLGWLDAFTIRVYSPGPAGTMGGFGAALGLLANRPVFSPEETGFRGACAGGK